MKKNKYLLPLLYVVIFSTIMHIIALILAAALHRDINMLNYFRIISLSRIFPFLGNPSSFIPSVIIVLVLYLICFLIYNRKRG